MARCTSLLLAFQEVLPCLRSIFKLWCCLETVWVKWGSVGSRAVTVCSPLTLQTWWHVLCHHQAWNLGLVYFKKLFALGIRKCLLCRGGVGVTTVVLCALPPGEGTGKAGAETLAIHKVLQRLEYKWEQHYFCWASKIKVLAWGFRFMYYRITK